MASHVPFLVVRPDEQFSLDVKTRDLAATNSKSITMESPSSVLETPRRVTTRIPSLLRFPIVCILSLGVSSLLYTATADVAGYELASVSPNLTEGWQIGIMVAWKIVELGVAWFARYDYHDLAYLSLLTNLPHYFLLNTFYGIDYLAALIPLVIDVAAISLPFALFRRSRRLSPPPASKAPYQVLAQDRNVQSVTALFGAALYGIVVYAGFSTWLPTHMILHFEGLRSLEKAHSSAVLLLLVLLFPMGYASTQFLFVPAIAAPASHSDPSHRSRKSSFHPETATLGETVAWNFGLAEVRLSNRAKVLAKRTAILVSCTLINTFARVFFTIEGTEWVGALGWAANWTLAATLVGLSYAWVGHE